MNKDLLEINVNLHALNSDFLNSELHYVIAADENNFRFVEWQELPQPHEQRFYAFLTDKKIFIPAGNVTLEEGYVLRQEPYYPTICCAEDFIAAIADTTTNGPQKRIRQFDDNQIDIITRELEQSLGDLQRHLVKSSQGQHLLLITDDIEMSISHSMVYFRNKTPFSQQHYDDVQEQKH